MTHCGADEESNLFLTYKRIDYFVGKTVLV
jgi:hypothetical protein